MNDRWYSKSPLDGVEMIAGRKMAVLFFDEHNPKEAVVIAVYG
jgi:hypothetical protein